MPPKRARKPKRKDRDDDKADERDAKRARTGSRSSTRIPGGPATGGAILEGSLGMAPNGRERMWTDDYGSTVLEEVPKEQRPSGGVPYKRKNYRALYFALERTASPNLIQLLGHNNQGEVEDLGQATRGGGGRGSLGMMRSWELLPGNYRWRGNKSKAQELRLDPASHRTAVPKWTEVLTDSRGRVQLYMENPPARDFKTYEKPVHELRKKRKGRENEQTTEKSEKKDRPVGVPVMVAGARGSTRGAMGNRSATDVAFDALGPDKMAAEPYEWCHLVGHGEGGPETSGNLIAATYSANTEQLAIEEGFRMARKHDGVDPLMKVTAYPIPESRDVADWIRYKIVKADGTKILDHAIDGKGEQFKIPQFYTLRENVRYRICKAYGVDPDVDPPGTKPALKRKPQPTGKAQQGKKRKRGGKRR
jgi:hypothetical protein